MYALSVLIPIINIDINEIQIRNMTEAQPAGYYIRNENYFSYGDLVKKAVGVNRIASDEYFRVRKAYKEVENHPMYRDKQRFDNYSKQTKDKHKSQNKYRPIVPMHKHEWLNSKDLKQANQVILTGNFEEFKEFVKHLNVKVSDDVLYTIDKVVRDRLRKSRYGLDFSEYVNLEKDEQHKYRRWHHEMLRLGKSSILIEHIPHSIALSDKLAKSPMLPHNVSKHHQSKYDTIRKPRSGKRAKTVAKYGSCRNGLATAKEDYAEWRIRQHAYDRMTAKLIEQAKDEVRHKIYVDMLGALQALVSTHELKQSVDAGHSDKHEQQPEAVSSKHQDAEYKSFGDFCFKTKREIYPNPVF